MDSRLKKLNLKKINNSFLKDETDWLNKETTFLEKLLPVLSHNLLHKFILFVFILLIIVKYFSIFVTIIFSLITSYIKFKRQKKGILIEIEPSYLFPIILTISFGIKYGLFYIFIPVLMSIITLGFSTGLIVNTINKLIVTIGVFLFWEYTTLNIIWVSVILVIVTDLIGTFLRFKLRQPPHEIILTVATNALLRFTYFFLFLEIIVNLLTR
ncbi:hypothetical protein JXB41_02230 [Candidatus Woesearchaeota archaeon]|nr:hypothetical protein [Candidatus Woesearchaeota archaeon]